MAVRYENRKIPLLVDLNNPIVPKYDNMGEAFIMPPCSRFGLGIIIFNYF